MKAYKLILVDDNEAFRTALKSLLVEQYNAQILGEASCAEEFWKIKAYYKADMILMDVMMPKIDGIELTRSILWSAKDLKIIALTMYMDKIYLTSLLGAGFMGCIFKDNLINELELALNTVYNGNRYYPQNVQI